MAHPADYEWTRNLVVASGFGLKLKRTLQGDIPPFRDGYQTALFYAVSRLASVSPGAPVTLRAPAPRIFEIGRSGPIDLTVPIATNIPSIHPQRPRPFPAAGWYLAVPVLLLGLLYLLSESVASAAHGLIHVVRAHPLLVLTLLVPSVLGALSVGYLLYSNRYAEEPLLWLDEHDQLF